MKNTKYLRVEGNHMFNICYFLLKHDVLDERNMLRHGLVSYTGDKCTEIFEKNNIPLDFQKIFIKSNPQLRNALKRQFVGYEFFTNIPINIFKNDYGVNGEMVGEYPSFKFINGYVCDESEIKDFITNLKRNDLLNAYINCIGEIFQINIKANKDKEKNLVR